MPIRHKVSILLLYLSALVSLNNDFVSLSLYAALPASFIFSLNQNSIHHLFKNRYFRLLIILYLWFAFTSIFAVNFNAAVRQFNQLLGVVLLFATIVNLSQDKRCIPWLYGIYVILAIAVFKYVSDHIFSIAFNVSTSRIGDDKLNTNTIAYYTFFLTCAFYILGTLPVYKLLKKLFTIAFFIMIPASFGIAIYTASRQVLIIQIPLIILLIYVRFFYGNRNVFKYLIAGVIVIGFIIPRFSEKISEAYDNSYLKQRSERHVLKDPRVVLMEEAIHVGIENPIVGVGPGNFAVVQPQHMFSHCSFTEIFANSGLLPLLIYVYYLGSFPILQIRNYRKYKKKDFLVFAVIGTIYFFYNFFYVFYIDLWLMSFFAVVTSHALILENKNKREFIVATNPQFFIKKYNSVIH